MTTRSNRDDITPELPGKLPSLIAFIMANIKPVAGLPCTLLTLKATPPPTHWWSC